MTPTRSRGELGVDLTPPWFLLQLFSTKYLGKIVKLGEDVNHTSCDGTYSTAPSLSVGHLFLIFIILAMFHIAKATMTGIFLTDGLTTDNCIQ